MLLPVLLMLLVTSFAALGCEARPERPGDDPAARVAAEAKDTLTGTAPDPQTEETFEAIMAQARDEGWHERPLGDVMLVVGEELQGRPYAAGLLDASETEQLVCTLNAFDCVTFVESVLAMARGIRAQDYTFGTFQENVRETRYRGGEMDGYCSRMHYFTEWIADNEQRGIVRDVTREVGGVPLEKTLDFMSTHRSSYPRFAEDDSVYACVREMEASLRGRELYYIPQNRIRAAYDALQAGDIVAFVTDIKGLDVTHTGLIYENADGSKGVLHASTSGGVKVSTDLQGYVENVKRQIGIVVARPLSASARS